MKTLDEVIAELEDEELFADALHYLKEYRSLHTAYIKAMADLEDNPPLTWDGLKGLVGKPVWVEDNNGWYKNWVVIEKFEDDDMFTTGFTYEKNNFGTVWQAYRKERK